MTEKTVERKCGYCGKAFRVIPSRLKHGRGMHCSPACQYAAMKARDRKSSVVRKCLNCGNNFNFPKSKLSKPGGGKYCSRQCRDQHWAGPNTPNWQGGGGVNKRGERWYSIRRRILARDRCCQSCGKDKNLHIHHIIPFRMFATADEANIESNLVALCAPCHRREDAKHKWVCLPESGTILKFNAGGPAWAMAREIDK